MQVCTLLQIQNHTSTPPLFFTGRVPFLPPNQQRHITEGISTEGINVGAVNSRYIIFTARRCYASAGTSYRPVSVSVSVSVCLSVTSRSSIETDERIELVLAWELPSTHHTPCCKKIMVPPKIRYIPLEICSKLRTYKISPRYIDHRNILLT